MKKPKYIYNAETCHYEPARITFRDVFITTLGILFTTATLFASIVLLHNRFVTTDYERSLRAENRVLEAHKPVLEKNLSDIESALSGLKSEERDLYTKIFNSPPPQVTDASPSLSKEKILLADASDFQSMLNVLKDRSGELFRQSVESNEKIHDQVHITKDDAAVLIALPSIQPLADAKPDMLVSGFGKRVNPFHKGMYMHPGVDFVSPRGTPVLATASGYVSSINKSDLQAGYGNSIVLDHGHGFATRYAHLEEIQVRPGQKITRGMVIGTVGNSGGSVAPHLHYEVLQEGEHADPALYLLEGISTHQYHQFLERSKKQNQSLD